jgi:hypothetical protein
MGQMQPPALAMRMQAGKAAVIATKRPHGQMWISWHYLRTGALLRRMCVTQLAMLRGVLDGWVAVCVLPS